MIVNLAFKSKLIVLYFKSKIVKTLNFFGFRLQVNQIKKSSLRKYNVHVLQIGHGNKTIPPYGWGAVETVIHELDVTFENMQLRSEFINSESIFTWLKFVFSKPDLIIVHDESKCRRVNITFRKSKKLLITHYAYAAQTHNWEPVYAKLVKNQFKYADVIGCLSPFIRDNFASINPEFKLVDTPNGILSISTVDDSLKNKKFVNLGKIEVRKRQFELAQLAEKYQIAIDFIGPIADKRVTEWLRAGAPNFVKFLGEKSRNEIQKLLPQYETLIHLSDAEADALVLYEAQASGLQIITNEESLGSQFPGSSWLHLTTIDEISSEGFPIIKSVSPEIIRKYAHDKFLWEARVSKLFALLSISQNGNTNA